MTNENKFKNTFSPLSFLPKLNLTPDLSTSSPDPHRGVGNEGCGQLITYSLCLSFLLTLFLSSSMVSYPQDTALHELLTHEFFTQAAALQEQLQHGSPNGSQVLPGNCSSVISSPRVHLFWCGLSMGCNFSQGTSTCSCVRSAVGF